MIANVIQLLEKGWTQGVLARDASEAPVHFRSSEARSFCLLGAIMLQQDSSKLLVRVQDHLGMGASDFNDTHSKEEVIAKLKEML